MPDKQRRYCYRAALISAAFLVVACGRLGTAGSGATPGTTPIPHTSLLPSEMPNAALVPVSPIAPSASSTAVIPPDCNDAPTPVGQTKSMIADFAPPEPLSTLVQISPVIVIGTVQPTAKIINGYRDVSDPTRPDTHQFGIDQVYEVTIQRYLKGQGATTIAIVQIEGSVDKVPWCVTPADIAYGKQIYSRYYVPFEPNAIYLLLLSRVDLSPEPDSYFGTSGLLARWRLQADGTLVLETPEGAALALTSSEQPDEPITIAKIEQLLRQ